MTHAWSGARRQPIAPSAMQPFRARDAVTVSARKPFAPPVLVTRSGRTSAILSEVARKHDLSVSDITSGSRLRHIVPARQEAMWRLRQETTLSLVLIAGRVGLRDHTSVLWGVRAHEKRLAEARA